MLTINDAHMLTPTGGQHASASRTRTRGPAELRDSLVEPTHEEILAVQHAWATAAA